MRLPCTTSSSLLSNTARVSLAAAFFALPAVQASAQQHQAPFSTNAARFSLAPQSPLDAFPQMSADANNANVDEPSSLAQERIADAQRLFGAKPELDIFKRSWAPDAIFEDPICYAQGWKQYASQWYAMQLFSKSITSAWRITKDTPEEVQYVQKQVYGIDRFKFEKEMHSTVVMKLDRDGRITHFQDRWDHKDMPGAWAYPLRRLNALVMPFFISRPNAHPDQQQQSQGGKKEL